MNVKQLKTFLAVANYLSFAEAAKSMHLSQPALSLSIRSLETELGGKLFHRTTRTTELSAEGKALLPMAKDLINHWENVEEELRLRFALKIGKIAIAAMPSFAGSTLPLILKEYKAKFPDILVEVHDILTDSVIDYVRSGRIELGIGFKSQDLDEDLVFHPLFLDRFKLVVPEESPLAKQQSASWNDIKDEKFIALQKPSSVRSLLESRLSAANIDMKTSYDAHQLATIGQMVSVGLGVSVVPGLCEDQMSRQGAVCIDINEPSIENWVGVVSRPRSTLSAIGLKLLDTIKAYYQQDLNTE